MRYHVQLKPYSLAEGRVGETLNNDMTLSQHRSLRAAGRRLGSIIRGKRRVLVAKAGLGNGYRLIAKDTETGREYPRNACK